MDFVGPDGGEGARDAKVGDFHPVVGGYQQIVGFEVAVNQSRPVRIANPGANLDHQLDGLLRRERSSASEEGLEIGAAHIFHDDEVSVPVAAKIVDGDDVGVEQIGGGAGFLLEAGFEGRIIRVVGAKDLDGDLPLKGLIVGA